MLTKSDLVDKNKLDKTKKKLIDNFSKQVMSISINDLNSLITLKKLLLSEQNKNKRLVKKKWSP